MCPIVSPTALHKKEHCTQRHAVGKERIKWYDKKPRSSGTTFIGYPTLKQRGMKGSNSSSEQSIGSKSLIALMKYENVTPVVT
jgi:hypothetical protein